MAVTDELQMVANEARRYAGFYPEASDGRNTFIIFAEWVEMRQAALSLPVSNTGENAYVAILRHNDDPNNLKAVLVPLGQTLEFDEDAATRRWLWPHLGYEFHLVAFVPLEVQK